RRLPGLADVRAQQSLFEPLEREHHRGHTFLERQFGFHQDPHAPRAELGRHKASEGARVDVQYCHCLTSSDQFGRPWPAGLESPPRPSAGRLSSLNQTLYFSFHFPIVWAVIESLLRALPSSRISMAAKYSRSIVSFSIF